MPEKNLKTTGEVRAEFRRTGTTVRDWARNHHVSERTTYAVLRGDNKGNYGEAHHVAVLLGLKEGEASDGNRN